MRTGTFVSPGELVDVAVLGKFTFIADGLSACKCSIFRILLVRGELARIGAIARLSVKLRSREQCLSDGGSHAVLSLNGTLSLDWKNGPRLSAHHRGRGIGDLKEQEARPGRCAADGYCRRRARTVRSALNKEALSGVAVGINVSHHRASSGGVPAEGRAMGAEIETRRRSTCRGLRLHRHWQCC